jgi:YidC/Oxa1 family membrane protein insertase
MFLLDPFTHVLAAVLSAAHAGLTALGLESHAGLTWLLCIAAVVALVRVALLPFVVHGVRTAHAAARARPQLQELTRRYGGRKDPASRRAFLEARRRIAAEHRMTRFGCLPLLVQLPFWFALYRLLSQVAAGNTVGAMSVGLVASLGGATLLGVRLAEHGYLGAGLPHLLLVAGLAGTAAALSYVTQKQFVVPNTVLTAMPDAMARAQRVLPVVSATSLLLAAGVVPVAMLTYWVCNGAWTLGQSAVVWRWFPTPGSPAAARATRH